MTQYKYNAFISYRHAEPDMRVAKEIQQQLERFRIPTAIQQKSGMKKIERIFKDQEELELTDDLSRQLEENLRDSEYLIVVCSPSYLQSKWCLLEVENYLKYHDRDHVICVLADGEPPAIFPDILRRQTREVSVNGRKKTLEEEVEPLAADYRQDFRDARRIELPRIAARIIGCSYDELVMRQEKYRRRKLAAILAGVFTAAVIAISYLLWSNYQINRNYQRSLISESRVLAEKSLSAMEETDRFSALESALSALPSEGNERPVVDEALYAAALASYAYQTPYGRMLETWRIDQPGSITDYFPSRDGRWLVCLNSEGAVTTYSLSGREKKAEFSLNAGAAAEHIEEGAAGQLFSYYDGAVHCFDYLKGEESWSLPLKYQWLGIARLSHDEKYIASADTLAIQVMTVQGEPYLSMPLPADIDDYITDFIWSPDDLYLAVVLRSEGRYMIGYYEFDTSRFHLHDEQWQRIDRLCYGSDDTLYIIADNGMHSSAVYHDSTYLIPDEYFLTAYRQQEKIYSRGFSSASLTGSCYAEEMNGQGLLVAAGNQLMLVDRQGQEVFRRQTADEIVGILDHDDTAVSLALYNGEQIMVALADGASISVRQFTGSCQQAEMLDNGSYLSVSDGNLQIYETVYDDSLEYYDQPLASQADCCFTEGNILGIIAGRTVTMYDRTSRQLISTISLDQDHGYHWLQCRKGELRILKVDSHSGRMSVLFYDLSSGQFLRERDLGLREFHVANGYLSSPMNYSDAFYLESYYRGTSPLVLKEGCLYLHQQDNDGQLVIYDMDSDELSTLDLRLPSGTALLDNTILSEPSRMAVSPDGRKLFTVMRDQKTGVLTGGIFDLKSGQCLQRVEGGFDDRLFVWKENLLIVREHSLDVLDADGKTVNQIPLTSQQPVALDSHDGLIICLFPDGRLTVCRGSAAVKTVRLPFADGNAVSEKMIGFQYDGERLYLLWQDRLAAVDLTGEGTTPLFTVDQDAVGCLTDSDEILISTVLFGADSGRYYAATYHQYSPEELISRAKEQLEAFQR
ncbi:MAG: toll/interleukin-1 receptor domain-containing protein [Erysipelotrichaceae bacterium]|nr:toll/interleukin-1 receptor domain-containing protein [Erysipelotrichaceae bacterium]